MFKVKQLYYSIIFSTMLHTTFPVRAQIKTPEIGERFDYTFTNLLNYPAKTAKVSNFRDKLLILDFWNTGCSSCIASWPKLLKLQEQFKEEIQIILVNTLQSEDVVKKSFADRKKKAGVDMILPAIFRDTVLKDLFPAEGVPTIAWFDQEGFFRSFTNASYLSEETIAAILNKKQVAMHQLPFAENGKSTRYNYENSRIKNFRNPLFVNGNGEESRYMPLVTQSVLTGKIDGLPQIAALMVDSMKGLQTATIHGTIDELYKIAYYNANFEFGDSRGNKYYNFLWFRDNRVEWKAKSPNFLFKKPSGEFNLDYFYCYQLSTQLTSRKRIQKMIQSDLEKYFGLEVRLEKRKMKCLVLSATDTILIKEKVNRPFLKGKRIITPRTVTELINYLTYTNDDYYGSPYPIIDETGYKGKIGGFKVYEGHEAFNKELQQYGLSLTLQEREIDVLVVEEPEGYIFPPELEYKDKVGKIEWKYQ